MLYIISVVSHTCIHLKTRRLALQYNQYKYYISFSQRSSWGTRRQGRTEPLGCSFTFKSWLWRVIMKSWCHGSLCRLVIRWIIVFHKDTFSCSTKQFIASLVKYKYQYSVPKIICMYLIHFKGWWWSSPLWFNNSVARSSPRHPLCNKSCTCHEALSLRENGPVITQKSMGVDPLIFSQQSLFNGCHAIYMCIA